MPPKEINFTRKEQEVIDVEIDKLLIKGIITETTHIRGEYVSTIFVFVFCVHKDELEEKTTTSYSSPLYNKNIITITT